MPGFLRLLAALYALFSERADLGHELFAPFGHWAWVENVGL